MKEFEKSPAHYKASLTAPHEREVIGTGTHMAVLEPSRFDASLERVPNRLGGNGTKAREMEAAGRFVVTEKEYTQIRRQADAILNDNDCRQILTGGLAEVSLFWRDAETGVNLRARADYIRPKDGVIVDLKYFNTVADLDAIRKQVARMAYHRQSRLYLDAMEAVYGVKSTAFVHIFVSDDEPFTARPIVLGDASLDKAKSEITELLKRFGSCLNTDQWPVFERPDSGLTVVELPDYCFF
jgi:hypothetical protein